MPIRRGRLHPAAPFLFLTLFCSACGSPAQQPAAQPAQQAKESGGTWDTLRAFNGDGTEQTESFNSETGALRVEWEAKPKAGGKTPGTFRVALHSAISGRPLTIPIDHHGPGKGTVFISEEPRVFFFEVQAEDLQWQITVAERLN
jgi:hypothetical protein